MRGALFAGAPRVEPVEGREHRRDEGLGIHGLLQEGRHARFVDGADREAVVVARREEHRDEVGDALPHRLEHPDAVHAPDAIGRDHHVRSPGGGHEERLGGVVGHADLHLRQPLAQEGPEPRPRVCVGLDEEAALGARELGVHGGVSVGRRR